jgi:hypothetical protein
MSSEYTTNRRRTHTLNRSNTRRSLGDLKTRRKLEDGDVKLKLKFNKETEYTKHEDDDDGHDETRRKKT